MPTLPPELRPPFTPPTEAERAAMLAGVDKLVWKLVRRSRVPGADQDDAHSECMMELWKASAKFDPAGPAKFGTFATYVVRKVLARLMDEAGRVVGETTGKSVNDPDWDIPDYRAAEDEDADRAADQADRDAEADRAFTRREFAGVLDALTPAHRKLVELIAVDGLTADQAAGRLGWQPKVVRLNLIAALGRLAKAGRVPAELARACGLDVGDLLARGDGKARLAHARARRARVRELLDQGWPRKRIIAHLMAENGDSESAAGAAVAAVRKLPAGR